MYPLKLKDIDIKEFLKELEITPSRENGRFGIYISPLRTERTPSFKVDYKENLWYDFGIGKGGSIIDLVMHLEKCDSLEAIQILRSKKNIVFIRQNKQYPESNYSGLTILKTQNLSSYKLISYLQQRFINISIATRYCKEVNYTSGQKEFYAIGFANNGGGWELRNPFFKGSSSPKTITKLNSGSADCLVFEGFMDFLSFLTLKNISAPIQDSLVLNSVSTLSGGNDFLLSHRKIHCFLDNDTAGKNALDEIRNLGIETIDHSESYKGFKDLNEFLTQNNLQRQEQGYVFVNENPCSARHL